METQNAQPIIIQERSSGGIAGKLITAGLLVGAAYYGHKLWVEHQANSEAGKLDKPEAQAASKIYNAKHWYGNTSQVAYDAAREIAQKGIKWSDVANAFQKEYNTNINDFLDFLGADGKAQFFNILNLTQSSTAVFTGQPPAQSALKYDVINNYCFAVANKASNIRKSPEIISKGGITQYFGSSNIIGVAPINATLGLMTGVYKLSSDGKTAFIEFYSDTRDDAGNFNSLKKVWCAASNVQVVQIPKSGPTADADFSKYQNDPNKLRITLSKYDSVSS